MTRKKINYLHVGKCAGSQLRLICAQINEIQSQVEIVSHGHAIGLENLPVSEPYFFSNRHPFSRFVSGFYSRKRKGLPKRHVEWSPHEEHAFGLFEHANDLAESLFHPGELGIKAFSAMKAIEHTARNQADWFRLQGFFLYRDPPIWIIRQEHFNVDLGMFMDRAELGELKSAITVTRDPVLAHKNDYAGIPELSNKARRALRRWYAQDFEFHRACAEWIKVNSSGPVPVA